MQQDQPNALPTGQKQRKPHSHTRSNRQHEQVHVELVRGGILCAFFYHRIWPDYPGHSWDLVHAKPTLLDILEIDMIAQRRSEQNIYAPWTCRKKDGIGHTSEQEINHNIFIRKGRLNNPATPNFRNRWGNLIAKVSQGMWKFQRRCIFRFHADHTPTDSSKLRYLCDIIITSDVLKVAKLCYPTKTLNQILSDDKILGHFFPQTLFQDLRQDYGNSNDLNEGSVMHVLKDVTAWEH